MIRSTHRRGRHKVFIGMAPGVGQTCRMLQEGKEDAGGSFLSMESAEILPTMARAARERRITQIVLGPTMRARRKALFRRPLSERSQHQLRGQNIDLHLISEGLPPQPLEENGW
ncbi:MAG: hypothetical protein ACK587_08550 [Cyanobacteriota bacterium]